MIILDTGSGGTCRNSRRVVKDMIHALAEVDLDRKCILKMQLWDKGTEPQCSRLEWEVFDYAFDVARNEGFRTTASVFDKPSLDFLLEHDIPFVKLANRPYLRHLARYVPRGIPIIGSYTPDDFRDETDLFDYGMICVSDYPADPKYYESAGSLLNAGISDHTVGLDLWRKYHPSVYEKHFKLEGQTGPDCGPWCITPQELVEVVEWGVK